MSSLDSVCEALAAITAPHCQKCPTPHACCAPHGCALAKAHIEKLGLPVPAETGHADLRFMGARGCVLPPGQRPDCAKWSCEVIGPIWKRKNPETARQYAELCADLTAIRAALGDHTSIV